MEKMKFLKFAAAMLCCMFALTFVSCDDDDDEPQAMLKFNPEKVEVVVGASVDVTVSEGAESYTAVSSDEEIATVEVSENIITVTGVKEGSATVRVTDTNNKIGILSVTVKSEADELELDKNSVNMAVDNEEVVTVIGGTAPYTVDVEDENIATATVEDDKVTIKAIEAGTTTVTVTDKDQKTGTITVTVE